MKALLVCSLVFISTSSLWAQSRVQRHFIESNESPQQNYMISPMIMILPFGPQEIGARGSHEFANDGFIDVLNDSASAEVSAFAGKWGNRDGYSFYMSGNMRWDFHLVPEWTVFASPGIALRRFGDDNWRLSPSTHIGGFWNIQRNLALRADLEVEFLTPRVGVAFRY